MNRIIPGATKTKITETVARPEKTPRTSNVAPRTSRAGNAGANAK